MTFEQTARKVRGSGTHRGRVASATPSTSDRFFDKSGLRHADLRDAVLAAGPIRAGLGDTLWHYQDGVWLPRGDKEARRRSRDLLGQRWRRSHVDGLVADLLADEPYITDEQPTQWINCPNGLLDWRTGELLEHSPEIPTTYQLSVPWNPAAACPTVDRWLEDVVPHDALELVWEIIGTSIYPDQAFHRAVLLLGPGRNGKGTLLRLITALIGKAHVSAVTLQSLGENRFASAELFGKVANIAGDLDSRSIGSTDVFKMATGGDLITGERKHGQPFSFRSRATMLFSANEAPASPDHSEGFFSRWVVVPMDRLRLGPGDEDPTIERQMMHELDGMLVRAVDALLSAMDRGRYSTPASVARATGGYREDSDPVRRFIEDCLDVTGDPNDAETRAAVYGRYKEWCEVNGHRHMGANRFWGRLRSGIEPGIDPDAKVINGQRYAGGLQLVTSWH